MDERSTPQQPSISEQEDARLTALLAGTFAEQAGRATPAPDALVRLNTHLDARASARPWWAGHLRLSGAIAVALVLLALITPIRHLAAAGVHNAAQAVVTTISNARDFATGGSETPTPTAKPPSTPAATGAVNGSAVATQPTGSSTSLPSTTVTGSATRTGTNASGTATGTTGGTATGTAIPTPRATVTIPGGQTVPAPSATPVATATNMPDATASPSVRAGVPTPTATPVPTATLAPKPPEKPTVEPAGTPSGALVDTEVQGEGSSKGDPAKGPKAKATSPPATSPPAAKPNDKTVQDTKSKPSKAPKASPTAKQGKANKP